MEEKYMVYGKTKWCISSLLKEEIYKALDEKEKELRSENISNKKRMFLTSRDTNTIGEIIANYSIKVKEELKMKCKQFLKESVDEVVKEKEKLWDIDE